ncbi:MAG TPA: hypothetical protein VN253_27940 [Kofleriaceae bacterium]|nr:hypothetical protein [Kofleriaceae bacterium]
MSLRDKITSWFQQDGVHFVAHAIPKHLVDVAYDDGPIAADRGYLRVWLVDMFLAQSRRWFQDWQPAVQGRVKLTFADQSVELMRLAAPSSDKFKTGQSVVSNYVLLDLVPFRGGLVEIEAALLALKGADHLGAVVSILAGFADLVVPPIVNTIEIATKVKEAITKLFADSDEVHLAAHNTFGGTGGANQLRAGYLAVLRGTDQDIDRTKLCIKNDKLCLGDPASATPLTGIDYMLLRFETAPTRDDFQHFSDLAQLRQDAIHGYLTGDTAKGDAFVASAIARIATHPDLINADRRALAKLVRDEMAEYKDGGRAASPDELRTWAQLVGTLERTADHSPVSLGELLGGS